jgi:hypothetical protein
LNLNTALDLVLPSKASLAKPVNEVNVERTRSSSNDTVAASDDNANLRNSPSHDAIEVHESEDFLSAAAGYAEHLQGEGYMF